MEDGAKFWLLPGYSGAGNDIVLTKVDADGTLTAQAALRTGENPSCLCAGTRPGVYYAGCEQAGEAAVLRLSAEPSGLRIDGRYAVPGTGLCHLRTVGGGVLGCCYGSGDVFWMEPGGRVLWQASPAPGGHAHWGEVTPDGDAFVWADLGADSVFFCRLDDGQPWGDPQSVPLAPGSGPRQVIFLTRDLAAVILENGNAVALLRRGNAGWSVEDTVSCTRATGKNYPGGACLAPDGTLFVCNRGADTVAALRLWDGNLRYAGEWPAGGVWPRWVACSGNLLLAACQKSGCVCSHIWDGRGLRPADTLKLEHASCAVLLDSVQRERLE